MISRNSITSAIMFETGESRDAVERIVDAACRIVLGAFAECEAIPRQQRIDALRTADAFFVDPSESPYNPRSKGILERTLSKLDPKAGRVPVIPKPVQIHRSSESLLDGLSNIFAAEDPWAALVAWLEERRALNTDIGGEDDNFISVVFMQTAMLTLPIRAGGRK